MRWLSIPSLLTQTTSGCGRASTAATVSAIGAACRIRDDVGDIRKPQYRYSSTRERHSSLGHAILPIRRHLSMKPSPIVSLAKKSSATTKTTAQPPPPPTATTAPSVPGQIPIPGLNLMKNEDPPVFLERSQYPEWINTLATGLINMAKLRKMDMFSPDTTDHQRRRYLKLKRRTLIRENNQKASVEG